MQILGTVKHHFDGHDYDIVSVWDGTYYQVIIRDEQKRKIGPAFSISLEDAQDFPLYNQQPALDALIEIAKAEIDSGRVKSKASSEEA